jgi:hypothetical protein
LCLDDAADAIAYLAGKVRGNWQRAMDAGGEGVPTEPPANDRQAIRV